MGPLSGVSIGRLSVVGALWDGAPHVCGGGGGRRRCAAGGCDRAVLVWGGVSRGYTYHQDTEGQHGDLLSNWYYTRLAIPIPILCMLKKQIPRCLFWSSGHC